jgi:hypothetical protein
MTDTGIYLNWNPSAGGRETGMGVWKGWEERWRAAVAVPGNEEGDDKEGYMREFISSVESSNDLRKCLCFMFLGHQDVYYVMANTIDFTSARSVVTSVSFCPESATISPASQRVLFEQNQNQDVQGREEAAAGDERIIFPFPLIDELERNCPSFGDEEGSEEAQEDVVFDEGEDEEGWEDVTSGEDEENE